MSPQQPEKDAPRTVLPFARRTSGEVVVLRKRIEESFRVSIGKPLSDLRKAETAALHQLFQDAGVGLETVALHELPQNRADRRRMLRQIDDPTVRLERRGRFGKYKVRRHR